MNIDTWQVVKAASTKPFGFTPFYPGPGLGRATAYRLTPSIFSWKARQFDFQTRFIEACRVRLTARFPVMSSIALRAY